MILNTFINNFLPFSFCDASEPWQLGIQDPATPILEGMIHFHNYLMIFMIAVGLFVFWMLIQVVRLFSSEINPISQKFTHSSLLEIVWTIIPAFILLLIAIIVLMFFLIIFSSFPISLTMVLFLLGYTLFEEK